MDNNVIIECVRDKKFISEADMFKFGSKIANPSITDSQIGAFAMAVTPVSYTHLTLPTKA